MSPVVFDKCARQGPKYGIAPFICINYAVRADSPGHRRYPYLFRTRGRGRSAHRWSWSNAIQGSSWAGPSGLEGIFIPHHFSKIPHQKTQGTDCTVVCPNKRLRCRAKILVLWETPSSRGPKSKDRFTNHDG